MPRRRTYTPPSWYRNPEEQITEVRRLMYRWGVNPGFPIPQQPDYTPKSEGEVLLLTMHLPSSEGGPRTTRDMKTTCTRWWDEDVELRQPAGLSRHRVYCRPATTSGAAHTDSVCTRACNG
jgi:hypothetical protein